MSRTPNDVRMKLEAWVASQGGPAMVGKFNNQIEVLSHQISNLERGIELELAQREETVNAEVDADIDAFFEKR